MCVPFESVCSEILALHRCTQLQMSYLEQKATILKFFWLKEGSVCFLRLLTLAAAITEASGPENVHLQLWNSF